MAGGYCHQVVVRAPAAAFFRLIDFGADGALQGDPCAVGSTRRLRLSADGAEIVEQQAAREVGPLRMGYSYEIVNKDNPLRVVGYRSDVLVLASTADPGQCFCCWSARWEAADEEAIRPLAGMILDAIRDAEHRAGGAKL